MVARFGGEEFLVLMPETPLASAADAIRQLVQDADAALYQAKRAGRNRVAVAAGTT